MASVSFYHLTQTPLSQALPQLLEKAMQQQKKSVLRVGNEKRLESLDNWLWVYEKEGWLPHGKSPEPFEGNLIWLTTAQDNPIEAEFFFALEGASFDNFQDYERAFYLFDGTNENELMAARQLWKQLKAQEVEATYWKQNENSQWVKG